MRCRMKFTIAQVAALVASVSSSAIDLNKRATPLDVSLTANGNTMVKASITNTGSESYNLLYKGSLLDEAPVDKLLVNTASSAADFTGIMLRVSTENLAEDAFKPIMAGQTIELDIDIAELYDLPESGSYSVSAMGSLPVAALNSTELTGEALSFSSNTLAMDVDAEEAKKVVKAVEKMAAKRTAIQSDCSGSQLRAVQTALSNCQSLASQAAQAATSGSASRFQTFFKTTSSSTRSTVAARLRAVANDCGSTSGGSTRTFCSDIYGGCSGNVLAYTLPSYNYIAYCPLFFNYLPALSRQCYAQDQATTVLHEETHAPGVYRPGTVDNGYGYSAATSLSASAALANADSYALFANAVYLGC
ncbi:hypothetical protein D0863_08782 [Hortaea werneckii]|uniref:Neutral protease 2 n=1 Tax=Hortaea werneckii TaxID=91943 RepID=A0A3M7DNH7_HORWE|nr:hypothetical protein D0863_08782 [Hortaea werneckii]